MTTLAASVSFLSARNRWRRGRFKRLTAGRRIASLLVLVCLTQVHSVGYSQLLGFPFTIGLNHFLMNGTPVFLNILCYQPLEPGQSIDGEIQAARIQDDLRRFRAYSGGSDPLILRVYAQPTAQFPIRMPKAFYDGIRELGFYVVRDIYFDRAFEAPDAITKGKASIDAVIAEVAAAGAFDRIFSWEIGNEFKASGDAIKILENFLEEMRSHIKTRMAEPGRESFSNWVTWASYPPSDPLRTDEGNPITVPSLDYISFNSYSYDPERMRDHQAGPVTGTPYAGYLAALKARFPDKPLVVTESGLPDSPAAVGLNQSRLPPGYPSYRKGGLTSEQVAEGLLDRYFDARLSGTIAGFGFFEYLDEWHKAGDPKEQSNDPEEHFGLARFEKPPAVQLRFKLQQQVFRDLVMIRLPAAVPVLTGVTADSTSLSITGTTTVRAQVAAGATTPLRFRWESSRGRVVGDSDTVQFYAGGHALGPATVTVVAIDANDNVSQASTTLDIQAGAPSIEILSFGSSRSGGRVANVDLTKYKVVLYVQTDKYYVQPYTEMKSVWIRPDGYWWSKNFASNGTPRLHACVVPKSFEPPNTMTSQPVCLVSHVEDAINDRDDDLLPDTFEPAPDQDRYSDPDNDWATNLDELLAGTNPNVPDNDIDDDTLPDNLERLFFGTLIYGANDDPDADGLTNSEELLLWTHPGRHSVDSDRDGLPDSWETRHFGDLSRGPLDVDSQGVTNLDRYELGQLLLPAVVTGAATGISSTAATLNGIANPTGLATTAQFLYGLTTSYGSTTPVQNLGSGNAAVSITGGALSGLTCNTQYHFRATASNAGGTTNGADVTFTTGTCPETPPAPFIIAGLTELSNNGGWLAIRRDLVNGIEPETWRQVPWAAYNTSGGGVHVAAGDVDGDSLDEIVIGLGAGGRGWIAVLDDGQHGYALLGWTQVPWAPYNASNGEVYPAVGDIDGDGIAEIIAGLGPGSGGWFAIFHAADAKFGFASWQRVNWEAYNAGADGSTHPAVADVDNDGFQDIVLGLGTGSLGYLEIKNGGNAGFTTKTWIQVSWPNYNAQNGTTYPAASPGLIVIGLGQGGYGWLETRGGGSTNYAHAAWLQVAWLAYNAAVGETHPALGNLDANSGPELVVGLAPFDSNGGWFEVINPVSRTSFGWKNVDWGTFQSAGGGLFPAIGRLK